jgi:hypothetical protein
MAASTPSKAGRAGVVDATAVWAYCVADRMAPEWFSGLAGVGDYPVGTVAASGLEAAVSVVSLAEFGEQALARHLEDLTWLEATARAHHAVVEAVGTHVPVIPMRLATLYRDHDSLVAMLAERHQDFTDALGRVTGRTEWGVKVYAAHREPEPAVPGDTAAADRPGAAYLRRRRNELDASRNAQRAALASADEIHTALGGLAVAAGTRAPQAPQLTGQSDPMILNAVYLVDDAASGAFAEAVQRVASQHELVSVELTGPWPPYSFAFVGESAPAARP